MLTSSFRASSRYNYGFGVLIKAFLIITLVLSLLGRVAGQREERAEEDENVGDVLGLEESAISERMQTVFSLIDVDGDKKLTKTEIRKWLVRVKTSVQQKQVALEVKTIDKDNDGLITIEELKIAYSAGSEAGEDQIVEVEKRFKIVDKNQDGSLDSSELAILMDPSGDLELLKLESDEILASQDKDKDGKITLMEFGEGEASGEDLLEIEKEFKTYDTNVDGSIDREEIEKVISDPHQHEVEAAIKELELLMDESEIKEEEWKSKMHKYAIGAITDNGELLRLPADYPGLGLPFENTETPDEAINDEL